MVDHTNQFTAARTMDRATLREMSAAAPMRDVVRDNRHSVLLPTHSGTTPGHTNFVEPRPHDRPWGLSWGRKEGPLKDADQV